MCSPHRCSKKYELNTGTTADEMGKGSKRTYTSVLRALAAMGEDVAKVGAPHLYAESVCTNTTS